MTEKRTCGFCGGAGGKTEVATEISMDLEGNAIITPVTKFSNCSNCNGSGKV